MIDLYRKFCLHPLSLLVHFHTEKAAQLYRESYSIAWKNAPSKDWLKPFSA